MRDIDCIYIPVCASDLLWTTNCLASIRYWYPEIPIKLIVDEGKGRCDVRAICGLWGALAYPTTAKVFGFALSKFEALFDTTPHRYLLLDSDTVMLGPVLDLLKTHDEDFIIHAEPHGRRHINTYAYNLESLRLKDPLFNPPNFCFNSGQYVGTSGILNREDFKDVIRWTEPRTPLWDDVFSSAGDQGRFNYVLFKAWQAGRLTLGKETFYIAAQNKDISVTLDEVISGKRPAILHWCGPKSTDFNKWDRKEILFFFRKMATSRE